MSNILDHHFQNLSLQYFAPFCFSVSKSLDVTDGDEHETITRSESVGSKRPSGMIVYSITQPLGCKSYSDDRVDWVI